MSTNEIVPDSSPESAWPRFRGRCWKILTTPIYILPDQAFGLPISRPRGRQPRMAEVIVQAGLSPQLAALVEGVARRTKLWRREQVDVARELASHFREGLDAGATAETLAAQFGDPTQAARMIRRARMRCRSWPWQVCAWSFRAALASVALFVVIYLGLAARFYWSHPTITRYYAQEMNTAAQAIPEADRAWPFYREAVVKHVKHKLFLDLTHDGWWFGTSSSHLDSSQWKVLVGYVHDNAESLRLIREGASRPKLGFIYGDPADRDCLGLEHAATEADLQAPLISNVLPHVQYLHRLARLLGADALVAAANGDSATVSADLRSLIAMAEKSCPNQFAAEEFRSYVILTTAIDLINNVLANHPQLLSDELLVELAHQMAAYHGGGTLRASLQGDLQMFDDLLQRTFTDDGHGQGHLTAEGFRFLPEFGEQYTIAPDSLVKLIGPGVMATMASRQELQRFTRRWVAQAVAERQGPLYQWPAGADSVMELERLRTSHTQAIRYLPALLFLPALYQTAGQGERVTQQRDGVLTAIGVELYRRQHGALPETLDQLVPRYLPELPLDRFTGKPLRYRIIDGQPLIYSCGSDKQDDGGHTTNLMKLYNGGFLSFSGPRTDLKILPPGESYDWVLYPLPRTESAE